jgi:hypothetical protein
LPTVQELKLLTFNFWQEGTEDIHNGFVVPWYAPKVLHVSGALTSGVSVPRRFMYPNGESIDNATNLSDAIQRQFSSGDKINEETWLFQ